MSFNERGITKLFQFLKHTQFSLQKKKKQHKKAASLELQRKIRITELLLDLVYHSEAQGQIFIMQQKTQEQNCILLSRNCKIQRELANTTCNFFQQSACWHRKAHIVSISTSITKKLYYVNDSLFLCWHTITRVSCKNECIDPVLHSLFLD